MGYVARCRAAVLSPQRSQPVADHHPTGVAFTIDPAHATEVRAYLGMQKSGSPISYNRTPFANSHLSSKTTAKRYCEINPIPIPPPPPPSSSLAFQNSVRRALRAPQDGYTLERVDVYGIIHDDDEDDKGPREAVVISGVECYVARNDNPSFGAHSLPQTFDLLD